MKKILFILESRASYGYAKNLYKLLIKDKSFKVKTLITGTHMSGELGLSIKNIKSDKIKIDFKTKFDHKNFAEGIGKLVTKFTKVLKKYKPNIVLIFGDRAELMSIAIGCCYSHNVALAHVQAGDRSGHIDDMTRMALSKMAHIHFPATKKAFERLIKLGEEKRRIYLVGAPQLDDINYDKIQKEKYIKIKNNLINLKENYFVILQHPVFKNQKKYYKLYKKTLLASQKFNCKKYIIYPNYDPGYKSIIKLINRLKDKNFEIFKHINRQEFLSLVSHSKALIGNSSSGLLESASLRIGVVNIGDRQNFRERNINVFDSKYETKDIYNKIKLAIKIKKHIKKIKNIHGDGNSSKRIYKILKKIKIDENLLNKNTTY